MLKILHNIGDVNFSEVLNVYGESVARIATAEGFVTAENGVYDDLSLFLSGKETACYVWELGDRYATCVRCETYEDGVLLTCLETAPDLRRNGYAFSLVKDLIVLLKDRNQLPAYVHIHNYNKASRALHERLGFYVVADVARLIDGTVSTSYCTMKYE